MSSIIYNKAFEMQLAHNFYVYTSPVSPVGNEFKVNKQLEIIPTAECADLMKVGRMRFRRTAQGFVVFYQSYMDEVPLVPVEKPLVKLSDGAEFVFVVKMPTDSTALLTNVSNWNVGSKTYTADKLFMMDGAAGTTVGEETITLTASLANSVKPPLFTYFFQPSGGYTGLADVVVYDNAPTPNEVFRVDDVPYNTVTHGYSVEIDLTGKPKDFYTLIAVRANLATQIHITDFYVDANLAIQNVFGIIRIKYGTINRLYDSIPDAVDFKTFEYAFLRRSVYWRYYIAAQNLEDDFFTTYNLTVTDGNMVDPLPVAFLASNPGPDGQPYGKPDLKVRINGLDTVILTSTTKIPYTENARLKMNLFKRNLATDTNTKIADNLPNAAVSGIDSDQLGAAQTIPTITKDIAEIFVII